MGQLAEGGRAYYCNRWRPPITPCDGKRMENLPPPRRGASNGSVVNLGVWYQPYAEDRKSGHPATHLAKFEWV